MSVELGSIWIDNDSDLLVIVKSLEGSYDGKVKVVFNYIVRTGDKSVESASELELFLKTKTKLVKDGDRDYSKGYEDGKSRGITIGYNKRVYEESKDGSIDGSERKHSHYFKDVRHLDYIDVYQVCKLFEVDDPSHCTQHSIKKLLMSGKRGAKDKIKDITEARDTLNRYLQIEGIEE